MACDEATDDCVSCDEPDADGDGAASIACGGDDCDDGDADVSPDATEICDTAGVDEDCDPNTLGERDIDGDGRTSSVCCNGDTCGLDCDDSNAATYSGATEVCNGFDDDCDGSVDEGVQAMLWVDADRDGAGDPEMRVAACADTPGFVNNDDDCDDANPTANPAGVEACDEVDNDCDGEMDEDAVAIAWYLDADGDGFGVSSGEPVISCTPVAGHAPVPGDCDDTARDVNPLAAERCNARDDNCDGRLDYRIAPGNFEDDDLDGFADAMCPGGAGNDCDDRDGTVNPGAPELCDFRDNDCDGTVDGATTMSRWYVDADGDGWGDDAQPFLESCEPQAGRAFRAGDCDDTNPSIRPGVVDGCDGIDQDCDGERDENSPRLAYYDDGDGDGWGAGAVTFACIPPMDTTTRVGDCADDDDTRYPSAPEDCNVRDDDCDGRTDEGAALTTFYQDADRDGYGRAGGTTREACVAPTGFADNTDDCDDGNPSRNPGATELCNNVDDNCDMVVDGAAANAACAVANGTGICRSGGTCDIASCTAPFDDCDAVIANGCETDTRSTAEHCGGCGMACAFGDSCTTSSCEGTTWVQVEAGTATTCGRRSSGKVVCWGDNRSGIVNPDSTTASLGMHVIAGLPAVQDFDLSDRVGCAIDASQQAWCWGSNRPGILGTEPGRAGVGATAGRDVRVPAPVVGASGLVDIAVSQETACGVTSAGRVSCWGGLNVAGVDMSSGSRNLPANVPGISDASEIVGLVIGFCVRRTNGRVACWQQPATGSGYICGVGNPSAECGTPSVASLLVDATGLVPFGYGVCARRSGGSPLCWGGLPTPSLSVANTATPTDYGFGGLIGGGANLGGTYCSMLANSQCWHWESGLGTLGRGAGTPANGYYATAPTSPLLSARTFSTRGSEHICAIDSVGLLWCWGRNDVRQLGDGTTTPRAAPTLVADTP
jgi:hypothetical protein